MSVGCARAEGHGSRSARSEGHISRGIRSQRCTHSARSGNSTRRPGPERHRTRRPSSFDGSSKLVPVEIKRCASGSRRNGRRLGDANGHNGDSVQVNAHSMPILDAQAIFVLGSSIQTVPPSKASSASRRFEVRTHRTLERRTLGRLDARALDTV
jgi:hypothetical protein